MPINNVDLKPLDIDKIIEGNDWKTDSNGSSLEYTYGNMENAIKQGIKEALPEILDYVDKEVDKDFYTDIPNLEKEILKKLGI